MALSKISLLVLLLAWATFISVGEAGEYCSTSYDSDTTKYCSSGCCGEYDGECCGVNIGLIIGLSVSGSVTLFIILVIFCLCRRRQQTAIVYRQFDTPSVTVQQNSVTNQRGMIPTAGAQPGVTYPPYQPYPAALASNGSRPTSPTGAYPDAYPLGPRNPAYSTHYANPSGVQMDAPPPYTVGNTTVAQKD